MICPKCNEEIGYSSFCKGCVFAKQLNICETDFSFYCPKCGVDVFSLGCCDSCTLANEISQKGVGFSMDDDVSNNDTSSKTPYNQGMFPNSTIGMGSMPPASKHSNSMVYLITVSTFIVVGFIIFIVLTILGVIS